MEKSCNFPIKTMEKSCNFDTENMEKSCKIMLKRKIINTLLEWKNQPAHKALLIKGARQVGKTTTIREFARRHYKHFVELNFERTPAAKQAFAGDLDAKTIILNLSAMGHGPFVPGETLVFLDEIQSCPAARTAIKFLVEDGRFDYIESGSLLGINYRDVSSFPVGYEHQVDMYPLDLEEFLWACNISPDVIDSLRAAYLQTRPVPDFLHEQIMERFRQYLIIGGMPEAVRTFVENDDLGATFQVQRDIITSYRDDIAKYAGNEKHLAKTVFDSIPEQLSKSSKRFILANLEKGASLRKYANPTEWLVDAGIAYQSFYLSAFELPFSFVEKRNLYKLFVLDTGLLCNMGMQGMQFQVLNGDISINEGALTENFVADELAKKGIPLHYYDRKSKQELDFVFREKEKISIIEVKSGNDYRRHPSLNRALDTFRPAIGRAIVLSPFNVAAEGPVTYYPLYMAAFL